MSQKTKLSVVLPIRDGQNRIVDRVERVLGVLSELTSGDAEIVIVDDGSQDATPHVLQQLASAHPQIRVVRHSRPRGMEAAGQTGLERATGDVVFIQETDAELRLEDMQKLHEMSSDPSIVAARAESTPRPVSGALVRRLKAWGTKESGTFRSAGDKLVFSSVQMIRRPHLQRLAGPQGKNYRLTGETLHSTTVVAV